MILRESLITVNSLKYEKMLRDCNHLEGLELALHKERMKELEQYIKSLRSLVSDTLSPNK